MAKSKSQPKIIKQLINRLRRSHIDGLTHEFVKAKEEPPQCSTCGINLTVKYIRHKFINIQKTSKTQNYNIPISHPIETQLQVRPTVIYQQSVDTRYTENINNTIKFLKNTNCAIKFNNKKKPFSHFDSDGRCQMSYNFKFNIKTIYLLNI